MTKTSWTMDELADYVPTAEDLAHKPRPLADRIAALRANYPDAEASAVAPSVDRRPASPPATARRAPAPAPAPDGTPGADGTVPTPAEVAAWFAALGRPAEPRDITPGLKAFAEAEARRYTGTFRFMLDMRTAAGRPRGLTAPQAKGVLNTVRRDLPRPATEAPAATVAEVAPQAPAEAPSVPGLIAARDITADTVAATWHGRGLGYMTPDGTVVKLVRSGSGRVYGKRRTPGVEGWDYAAGILADGIVPVTGDAAEAARLADGTEAGACCFCATPLTADGPGESVHRGYGPVCAGRYGLPWGA
jgi:hypothetical protein